MPEKPNSADAQLRARWESISSQKKKIKKESSKRTEQDTQLLNELIQGKTLEELMDAYEKLDGEVSNYVETMMALHIISRLPVDEEEVEKFRRILTPSALDLLRFIG